MKEKKINGVLCEVGKEPRVVEIDNTLEALQDIVHGYIECVFLGNDIVAVINEEGKLNGSLPNRHLPGDTLFDDFIVLGDTKDGDFRSLTNNEIFAVKKFFKDYIDVDMLTQEDIERMRKVERSVSFF